jgi:hypothetical protein
MIRLYLADGTSAPVALCEVDDPDHEVMLDILDATPEADGIHDRRTDDTPTHWFIDAEAVDFLEWNGASAAIVDALRQGLAEHGGLLEVMWSELP